MADRAENNRVTDVAETDSRRQALAKIGVGAAVIWTAPLVTTLPGSAAAVGSAPPETTTTTPETTTTSTTSTTTTTTTAPPSEPVLDFSHEGYLGLRSVDNDGSTTTQVWQPVSVGRTGSLVQVVVRAASPGNGPLDPVGPSLGVWATRSRPPRC